MTLEKLLEMSASDLEALSDSDLETLCLPFYSVTRPPENTTRKSVPKKNISAAKEAILREQFKKMGMDYDSIRL